MAHSRLAATHSKRGDQRGDACASISAQRLTMKTGSTPRLRIMTVLAVIAERFAATIVAAVQREYPNAPRHVMQDEHDRPTPRQVHPAFYGCFDWHSAVEMHWALVALIRDDPDAAWVPGARAVLAGHLTEANLRVEAAYFDANPGYERPYGWGWALQLAAELDDWADDGDRDASEWAGNLRPLAEVIEAGFVRWLPKPAYPDRTGVHSNSAFALSRALPYATRRATTGQPALHAAIVDAARRWFSGDQNHSAAFEPSGSDFLSPTLTEMVLMSELLKLESFERWSERFLGDDWISDNLFQPARVTDGEDGQGAHLHGLNFYRAYAFRHLMRLQDEGSTVFATAAKRHIDASSDAITGSNWMQEHWLAAYAVLALR
jgi:DUF2891 family protein